MRIMHLLPPQHLLRSSSQKAKLSKGFCLSLLRQMSLSPRMPPTKKTL